MRKTSRLGLLLLLYALSGCSNCDVGHYVCKRIDHAQWDLDFLTPEVYEETLYLNLDDIIEIAINRNLDLLVKQQEWAVQHEKDTGEALQLIPSLIASGVSSWRNESTASSQLQNGQISTPIESSQQRVKQWDITATWNLLDFGATYFKSLQEHDRTNSLCFQYQRKGQILILDVYRAYWKAIAAQNAIRDAKILVDLSQKQQNLFINQISERNISQIIGLKAEAQLIDIEVRLTKFEADYQNAKAELVGLMGLSPFVCIELAPAEIVDVLLDIDDLCELENIALTNRPELYITDIDEKIALEEIRIRALELLPGPALFAGRNYDHDKFLLHHYWTITGIRAAWNLLSLPSRYYDLRTARAQKGLAQYTRLALTVGVLTQVNIAYITYQQALENYHLMQRMANVNQQLLDAVTKTALYGEIGNADVINYQMNALVSRIDALKAYGDLRVSVELLNNSVGVPQFYKLQGGFNKDTLCLQKD